MGGNRPRFAGGLDGLEPGDHIILLTWLHQADRTTLQVQPRGDRTRPWTGVFVTRISDRHNPIGLHPVAIRERAGTRLRVGPLEALDGTPVLDLKPVLGASGSR